MRRSSPDNPLAALRNPYQGPSDEYRIKLMPTRDSDCMWYWRIDQRYGEQWTQVVNGTAISMNLAKTTALRHLRHIRQPEIVLSQGVIDALLRDLHA